MSLFDGLLARPSLVWFSTAALVLAGLGLGLSLPSGVYPEVEFPRVVVVARSGDAPPLATQVTLTRPLEMALATVPGVERVRSKTIRGAVELSLQFAPNSDMWRALQRVESRVAEVRGSLPAKTDISVERLTTSSFPVLTFNLSGPVDPRRLREAAELVLKPAISRVRGVGRVEVLGGDVREVEVIVDADKAAALHLGPAAIARRLSESVTLQAVGRFEEAHGQFTVMVTGEPADLGALRALPVAVGDQGVPVPLQAVAEVREGAEDRLLRVSGSGGETVLLSVARLPDTSTPEVVRDVEAAVHAVRRQLPPGARLEPVYEQSVVVEESIRSVRDAILVGIVLCLAVIALFLRTVRAGVVAALAVPLTLAASFVPMFALGQSLNLMSLGGLAVAIGLVIDDAIVVVEGVASGLERGLSTHQATRGALKTLGPALVGTTATTVVVFLPLGALEGVVGRFFSALAITLASAVVLSLLCSVTVVPLTAVRWLRKLPGGTPRWMERFERSLRAALRRPWRVILVAAILAGLGVLGAARVPTGFLPSMDEGAFVLDYFLPSGTSLGDTDAAASHIEEVLRRTPEVATWSRRTGAELGPATATLVSRGDITVRLRAASERSRSADDVIAEVRSRLEEEVPEARVEFVQVLQDVLNDLSGAPRPLELKLFGDDVESVERAARDVAAHVRDVPGLVDVYGGFEGAAPELDVRVDTAAATRVGRSTEDIASELDTALHGQVAGLLRRTDRPLGVRVRLADDVRFSPEALRRLPLIAADGAVVPLSTLAAVERSSQETQLTRESLKPVAIVTADHEGRDLGSVARDVAQRLRGLALPAGVRLEMGGQVEGQRQTILGMLRVAGLSLVAVAAVLLIQFRRARLAVVVLASIPLAVIGAVDVLAALGVPLNASSLMGCVLLVGLVVKNGILLLERYEVALAAGKGVEEALVEAGRGRARPIAMTTLSTVAGLVPLALGFGAGSELQRPLAVAVIGGLAVSTLVSLILVPALVRVSASEGGSDGTPPPGLRTE